MSISTTTSLSSFRPAQFLSSAAPRHRSSNHFLPKASSSGSWWTPLFGWSPDPDYIASKEPEHEAHGHATQQDCEENVRPRSKFSGCFTEEKAKEMRKKMNENSNFHDPMYHSAIASRLASNVTRDN